jgi:hypothetical protein
MRLRSQKITAGCNVISQAKRVETISSTRRIAVRMQRLHAGGDTVAPPATPTCGRASAGTGEENADPTVFSLIPSSAAEDRWCDAWQGRRSPDVDARRRRTDRDELDRWRSGAGPPAHGGGGGSMMEMSSTSGGGGASPPTHRGGGSGPPRGDECQRAAPPTRPPPSSGPSPPSGNRPPPTPLPLLERATSSFFKIEKLSLLCLAPRRQARLKERGGQSGGGETEEPVMEPNRSARGIRKLLETPSDTDVKAWARVQIHPPFAPPCPGGAGDGLSRARKVRP